MPGPEQTPEDKLLEIIENPPQQTDPAVQASPRVRVRDFASFTAFLRTFDVRVFWQKPDLRHVNRIVGAVCAVLSVLCVVYFKSTTDRLEKKFLAISTPGSAAEDVLSEKTSKSFNFQQTLTLAKERNIFSLYHERTPVEGVLVGDGEATANLKLVGILWSDTNPQAMVEDTVEQKTHLLAVGDQVARLTVRSITKDKVILAREDRVWELR